ncbi:MAG: ubiquinone/menaquinone biosynthesis methyltransferase [Actinobacteria bacterium]|nr:ubiquinone/menaquinone biosynthesis methyltransferase [Actinomycetota bacterium]
MFDRIADRYDLVNRVMTFGLDVGWRRRAVRELRLPGGSLVADLACGTGDLCNELLDAGYRAVGLDFSHGMLVRATTAAPLAEADVLRLPLADASVDGATCGFALRNVTELADLFAETARVLRSRGRAVFLEAGEPDRGPLRAGHALYFKRIVPLIGGAISDREAYRYLPASMAYLPAPGRLVEMLQEGGFDGVERISLTAGAAQLLLGTRR